METTTCRHPGRSPRGGCWTCTPGCEACGWVECRCEEIAANLAANPPCPTCDSDQVVITCTECEDGLVLDDDEGDWETCPDCGGDYSIPCPDCGGDEG
jgi:hypothetical protein